MRACVASGATLARENAPVAESLTTTRLATTWLPAKLRSPAGGRATPAGKTTKEPAVVVVWMAVTLRTTAVGACRASAAGGPASPATWESRVSLARRGPRLDLRLSARRKGVTPIGLAPPATEYRLVYQP